MPPFLQFLIRRLFAALVSAIVITMVLFAGVMLAPPEERAKIYMPIVKGEVFSTAKMLENVISKYHMDEPYLVQYVYWVRSLFDGTWGYSPNLNGNVLPALLHRTPATLEIAFYSLLLLIPLGLASGSDSPDGNPAATSTAGFVPARISVPACRHSYSPCSRWRYSMCA